MDQARIHLVAKPLPEESRSVTGSGCSGRHPHRFAPEKEEVTNVSVRTILIALAAAVIAATPAPAQIPGPSVNLASNVSHELTSGRPRGTVTTFWNLDRPERCGPQGLTQFVLRTSAPRTVAGFTRVELLAVLTDAREVWTSQVSVTEKYQYGVAAVCGGTFSGSTARGPAFAMNRIEDLPQSVTYAGPWETLVGDFSGLSTHDARAIGASATLDYTGLAAAWVTTINANRAGDLDPARVECNGVLCDQHSTANRSFTRRRRQMSAGWLSEFDSSTTVARHRLRVISDSDRGVDVDAFLVVVPCPVSC
jgi:hypothetical protein